MKKIIVFFLLSLFLIADEQLELQKIKQQIEDLRSQINNLNVEKKNILDEIYGIELKMEMQRLEINRLQLEMRDLEKENQKLLTEIEKLSARIEKNRQDLKIFVRLLYKKGKSAEWSWIFLFEDFQDFFQNYFPLLRLINYKSGQINAIRQDMAALNGLQQKYAEQKAKLESLVAERDNVYKSYSAVKKQKLNLLSEVNRRKTQYLKMIEALKEQADYLERFLKNSQQEIKPGQRALNLAEIKGKMNWPLAGRLIVQFGRQKHPKFDAYILNNGIVIKCEHSREVRAVLNGEIVFSDYFRGYGKLLILQHNSDFYTLYGYLGDFLKRKGDFVQEGEVIALAGNSGPLQEEALYFEVRLDLKSEDPLKWLKKRK